MKRFLILLGILLVGCGPAPATHQDDSSSNEKYISKVVGKAYHGDKSCPGHEIIVEKHPFEEEGHDMWLWVTTLHGVDGYQSITVEHSPNCRKCNPEKTSIFDETPTTSNDWGW